MAVVNRCLLATIASAFLRIEDNAMAIREGATRSRGGWTALGSSPLRPSHCSRLEHNPYPNPKVVREGPPCGLYDSRKDEGHNEASEGI